MWKPRRLTALWASNACYRDSFTILRLLNEEMHFINILMHIFNAKKTNVTAFKGKFPVTTKTIIDNNVLEHIPHLLSRKRSNI
jgi:hypothetical protein